MKSAEKISTQRKQWNKRNRVRIKENRKRQHLKHQYGLTIETKRSLLESQGGTCAICCECLVEGCVDHCHEDGIVRGILCHHCNRALGLFRDNPERMVRAAEYVLHARGKRL